MIICKLEDKNKNKYYIVSAKVVSLFLDDEEYRLVIQYSGKHENTDELYFESQEILHKAADKLVECINNTYRIMELLNK